MSSTSSASVSTPSASSNSDNHHGGSFITSGGATLILAFLAIGLFLGGLLVLISMRRYRTLNRRRINVWTEAEERRWNWDDYRMSSLNIMRRQKEFTRRPELWDFLVDASSIKIECNWEDVMPLSAKTKMAYEEDDPAPRGLASATLQPLATDEENLSSPDHFRPFRVGINDFTTQVSALWPSFGGARSCPPIAPPSAPSSSESSQSVATEPSIVQVALIIALPQPWEQTCGGVNVPLYALGVADIRWSGEPHSSSDSRSCGDGMNVDGASN